MNSALLVCAIVLTWKASCFLFPLSLKSIGHFTILPSFMTNNKANSSGAPFICGRRIFGCYLIKYCGPDVTAAGMSIMILHCIRHGQTIKVLVMCEAHVPQCVPDTISSRRYISLAPLVPFASTWDRFCAIWICSLPALPCMHINTHGLNPCLHSECGRTQRAWLFRFLVTVCLID